MKAQIRHLALWMYVVYAWTIGHGGRTRAATEYRIQLKLPGQPKLAFDDGTTILIGLYDGSLDPQADRFGTRDARILVAWDPVLHLKPGASSSCQVSIGQIEEAYLNGAATAVRRLNTGIEEIIIAMRLENFSDYLGEVVGGHGRVSVAALSSYRNTEL